LAVNSPFNSLLKDTPDAQPCIAKEFWSPVEQAAAKGLTSDEHLAMDVTLLEEWATLKSFQPRKAARTSALEAGEEGPSLSRHGYSEETSAHIARLVTKPGCLWQSAPTIVDRLNRIMVGWANYFYLESVSKAYSAVDTRPEAASATNALRRDRATCALLRRR
jgi:hypothetical protein